MSWRAPSIFFNYLQLESISSVWKFWAGALVNAVEKDMFMELLQKIKLCALFKPVHCKLFLSLYNDMRALSGFSPVFKNWQLTKKGRRAAQWGPVLLCNPCLTLCQLAEAQVVSQKAERPCIFVMVQMRVFVTDMVFVEKVPPVLTHTFFEGGYWFLVCYHFPFNFFIANISFR